MTLTPAFGLGLLNNTNHEGKAMKIFDYTNGRKGAELAKVWYASRLGGHIVVKNGQRYRITLPHAPKNWAWHVEADNGFGDLTPETFGVEAICFCTGEWKTGQDQAEWEWVVIGTTEWNREACRSGVLRYEHLGPAFAAA